MSTKKKTVKLVVDRYLGIRAGEPTVNGHIYPKEVLEKAIRKFQRTVKDKRALAHFDSPDNGGVLLAKTAAVIQKVYRCGNSLRCEVKFLNDELKQQVLEHGMLMRACGIGDFKADGKTVADGFKFVSVGIYPEEKCL